MDLLRKLRANFAVIFLKFSRSPSIHKIGPWRLLLDQRSTVDRHLLKYGDWEAAQQDLLFRQARALKGQLSAVFLDVGSYFGIYSMNAVKSGIFDEVHAFEVDPASLAQLHGNLFLNNLEELIHVHDFAASDRNETLSFCRSRSISDGNRGGASITDGRGGNTITVQSRPIADVLDQSGKFIAGKIDTEGHEIRVLEGMRALIEKNKVLLQIESFDNNEAELDAKCAQMGLRKIGKIHVDHYFTNCINY